MLQVGSKYENQVSEFLEFLEDPRKAYSGTISSNELIFLEKLVKKANLLDGPIVEIGVLFGFTTQHIANWKKPDKELLAVDRFSWNPIGLEKDIHREFTQRILHYVIENANVELLDIDCVSFYKNYKYEKPSMVLIDASHRYDNVWKDIKWAVEMEIPIIAGHDYSDDFPGVKRAVGEFFADRKVEVVDSLWAVIR